MPEISAPLFETERGRILVASSQPAFREQLLLRLQPAAMEPVEASGGADALMQLESRDFRLLLLDSLIEDLDVSELIATLHARYPRLRVVVVEKPNAAESLCINLATRDPLDSRASPENERAACMPPAPITTAVGTRVDTQAPAACEPLAGMIGSSRGMQKMYRLARLVAPRNTAVLIVGPTGTGKELIARGIHELSRRKRGPFIVVNCAAIPENLLEAELFGFTRGAFTGAVQARLGRIHAAHGGTLLLDEVGELPLSMQAKLLRFVQEGEVQRLGSADLFRVDARLIAATNVDLLRRVHEKLFREDLYYRLSVFPLDLPLLSSRNEDILPLANHFLEILCHESDVEVKTISVAAGVFLRGYAWPGNVRELQHWIERAFVLSESKGQIEMEDVSANSEY